METINDYEGLKKEYLVLKKELDNVNQELHSCKRELKLTEALQYDYQTEIESLQSEENKNIKKLQEKIIQLKEELCNSKKNFNERMRIFEADVLKKQEDNEALKSELQLVKNGLINDRPKAGEEDLLKLSEQNELLQQENIDLLENKEELNVTVENLQKNIFKLEETLKEYKEEAINLKESLTCKRDELSEANNLIQKLNDEILCLQSELDSYKSKPLNQQSQGNSLFAEVDDRRVHLQKTINKMKDEYIFIKQERAAHLNKISILRNENKVLCDRWKKDMEEKEDDEYTLIKTLKDRIEVLEMLNENHKKNLYVEKENKNIQHMDYFQILLKKQEKEIADLQDELSKRTLTHVLLSTSLKEANKEMRKWRLESTTKQYNLEEKLAKTDSKTNGNNLEEQTKEKGDKNLIFVPLNKPLLASEKLEKEIEATKKTNIIKSNMEELNRGNKAIIKIHQENSAIAVGNQISDDKKMIGEVVVLDEDDEVQVIEDDVIEHSENDNCKEIKLENKVKKPILKNDNPILAPEENVVDEKLKEFSEDKENNAGSGSKKVTFSECTFSPKLTDRTALRTTNIRRIVVPKTIFVYEESQ